MNAKVAAKRRSYRAKRTSGSEFQSLLEGHDIDPNLAQIAAALPITRHPLEKVLKRLGHSRAWYEHVVSLLRFWPSLRYSASCFLMTVGVEIHGLKGVTPLADEAFRAFERRVAAASPPAKDLDEDRAGEYLVTLGAYQAIIDEMTAALRSASALQCCAADGAVWTLDQGPFDFWRRRHLGSLLVSALPSAAVLTDEQLRAKFMIPIELDFYHQRVHDDVAP